MSTVATAVVLGAVLFVAAGTLAWPSAWAFLAIFLLGGGAVVVMLLHVDPELLLERLRPPIQREQSSGDKAVMSVFCVVFVIWLPFMALDAVRLGWSQVPVALQVAGAAGVVADFLIVAWTARENAYLAPVVKSQAHRDQRVVSTGPYAYVRHPMYAGAVLLFVGTPLLLGSWWGLVGAAVLTALLTLRAVLEERSLAASLEGYTDYTRRVRYRLVPRVW